MSRFGEGRPRAFLILAIAILPWLAASLVDGSDSARGSSIRPESAALESLASVLVVVTDRPATGALFAKRVGDARLLATTSPGPGVEPSPLLVPIAGGPAAVGWADPLALNLSRRGPPPPGIG